MNLPSPPAQDWWKSFFSGPFVEMWLKAMPEEVTCGEVDFIEKALGVSPPDRLLDVPCGGGRHALVMAQRGYRVTGADYSTDFLTAAAQAAGERELDVAWRQSAMADLPWQAEFDGAYCFGNSFGYDTDEGNAAFLSAVARSLKPGARFVLDNPSVAEALLTYFQERTWYELGDTIVMRHGRYLPETGRTVTEYAILRDGQLDRRTATHRIYTYREMRAMLAQAGFEDIQGFGSLTGTPFRLGDKCLVLVARRK